MTDSTFDPKASVFDSPSPRCLFSFGDVLISEKVGRKKRNTDSSVKCSSFIVDVVMASRLCNRL